MTAFSAIRDALRDCPPLLRRQQTHTLRLARAFRAFDQAEAAFNAARAEVDEAIGPWSAGRSTNRDEARTMLELAGLIERKRL